MRPTPKEAIEEQERLRAAVRTEPLSVPARTIAGVDASIERFGDELYAGIVVLSYPDLRPICHAVAKVKADFPYIPGLLSFRELPGVLQCLEMLPVKPDLLMVDGQGIAHPRRLGIASHLGVLSGLPTVGCAKSPLYGTFDRPTEVGAAQPIKDPKTGDLLGYALKSKRGSNPLIVSPGHLTSPEDALGAVKACLRGYRLPEPTRLAHILVNAFRRGEVEMGAKLY